MNELNLMLHCGSNGVTLDELTEAYTPEGTRSWQPIPHHQLYSRIVDSLASGGLSVVNAVHGLQRDGNRYFGMAHVRNGSEHADYGVVLGWRNSHDKTFPAALALGAGVFVCDNLSFSGEIKLARKHTRFINRDLPQLVNRAVGLLGDHRRHQDERIAAYKDHEIIDVEAHDIVVNALDAGIVPASKIPHVLREWRSTQHPEFEPRTCWSLFNAFTEVSKGNASATLHRTQSLHGLMDSVCGLAVAS